MQCNSYSLALPQFTIVGGKGKSGGPSVASIADVAGIAGKSIRAYRSGIMGPKLVGLGRRAAREAVQVKFPSGAPPMR